MAKKQDRIIYQRPDGKWANKRSDASRPASIHDTQKEAVDAGTQHLTNSGGGELTIQGMDGQIRDKRTIAPGNDPHPPNG